MKAYAVAHFAQSSLMLNWSFLLHIKLPGPQRFRPPFGTQLVAILEVQIDLAPYRLSGMGPVRLVGSSLSARNCLSITCNKIAIIRGAVLMVLFGHRLLPCPSLRCPSY